MATASKSTSNLAMVSSASRPLHLRMRSDLSAHRQTYQGREYWVVKDPISLKYYRFEDEEFALLQMLDGKASPDQIKRRFDYRFSPQKITMQELFQFVGMLYRSSLLISDAPHQGVELKKRAQKNEAAQFRSSLTNVMSIRFKGFDPDRILTWMNGYTKWFFTWPSFALVFLLGVSALALVLTHFETFQNKLPSFQEFFAAKNWIYLALVMGLTKVCHEFGHGLACKKFGGQCHEMGVMLLVLTPCLYCNVSDAWMLPNKWRRIFISTAGMYVELVLASIATFVWWFSEPGMINLLALNIIFVSSVSTILFNANPLLRYDGYYILADLLEIPNLRQKASTILQRWAGHWLMGIEARPDPFLPARQQWAFALYSVAAAAYRWLITLAIFWFVYHLLEPYGLKLIGQCIALMALYGLLGMPLVTLYKFFSVPGRFGTVKPVRVGITFLVAMALFGAAMLIPIPHHVYCPFYVEPENAANVFVEFPGELTEILVEPNQWVAKGTPLVRLSSPELEETIRTMVGTVNIDQVAYDSINEQAAFDVNAANQKPTFAAALQASYAKLKQREQDIEKLVVIAPIDGWLIAPPEVKPDRSDLGALPQWHGSPLEKRNLGSFLEQKTMLGQIVPDLKRLTAVLAIDQSDIEFVQADQHVELLVQQLPASMFQSRTKVISPVKMNSVPKALASLHGGDLVTTKDDEGIDVPQSTTYQVSVPLENEQRLISPGSTGVAKISVGSQTVGWRIWRLACRTFRFEL
jgi:putative peptide zinc metalloprotease protein